MTLNAIKKCNILKLTAQIEHLYPSLDIVYCDVHQNKIPKQTQNYVNLCML